MDNSYLSSYRFSPSFPFIGLRSHNRSESDVNIVCKWRKHNATDKEKLEKLKVEHNKQQRSVTDWLETLFHHID
uniref:Uncharacterized protein n=1 Tax=Romanomermis culicivorax TaxID=13658 RepID=A0A915I6E0_ROMCU